MVFERSNNPVGRCPSAIDLHQLHSDVSGRICITWLCKHALEFVSQPCSFRTSEWEHATNAEPCRSRGIVGLVEGDGRNELRPARTQRLRKRANAGLMHNNRRMGKHK